MLLSSRWGMLSSSARHDPLNAHLLIALKRGIPRFFSHRKEEITIGFKQRDRTGFTSHSSREENTMKSSVQFGGKAKFRLGWASVFTGLILLFVTMIKHGLHASYNRETGVAEFGFKGESERKSTISPPGSTIQQPPKPDSQDGSHSPTPCGWETDPKKVNIRIDNLEKIVVHVAEIQNGQAKQITELLEALKKNGVANPNDERLKKLEEIVVSLASNQSQTASRLEALNNQLARLIDSRQQGNSQMPDNHKVVVEYMDQSGRPIATQVWVFPVR